MFRCLSSRSSVSIILFLLITAGSLPAGLAAPARLTVELSDVIKKADEILKAGDPDQALRALRSVYPRYQDPRILVRMGRAYLRKSEPAEAEHYCRLAQSAQDEAVLILAKECIKDSNAARLLLKNPFTSSLPPSRGDIKNQFVNKVDNSASSKSETQSVANAIININERVPVKQSILQMPPEKTPLHRRWWLWSGVAAAVAAGVVIGAVVPTYQRPDWPDAVILKTQQ